jgi:hypothetical protein
MSEVDSVQINTHCQICLTHIVQGVSIFKNNKQAATVHTYWKTTTTRVTVAWGTFVHDGLLCPGSSQGADREETMSVPPKQIIGQTTEDTDFHPGH